MLNWQPLKFYSAELPEKTSALPRKLRLSVAIQLYWNPSKGDLLYTRYTQLLRATVANFLFHCLVRRLGAKKGMQINVKRNVKRNQMQKRMSIKSPGFLVKNPRNGSKSVAIIQEKYLQIVTFIPKTVPVTANVRNVISRLKSYREIH